MDIESLVEKFKEKPYLFVMGTNKIAKQLHATPEEITKARKIAKRKTGVIIQQHPTRAYVPKDFPKILILDIETSPILAWVWSRWKQDIHLEQTVSEWFMLSWAAKWFLSAEVMSNTLTSSEVIVEEDKRILKPLWELLDEADIIVCHNGNSFDIPKINSRFIINSFPPPSPYKTIDTKIISSIQFGFSSNKLDALAEYFGFQKKKPTTFELWAKCMKGDPQALRYMEEYNKHDVVLLEEIYLKLRPWMKSHPNMGIYSDESKTICSVCGSSNVNPMYDKFYYTQTTKYPVYRCTDCYGITRGRTTVLDKEVKKNLGTSIPR